MKKVALFAAVFIFQFVNAQDIVTTSDISKRKNEFRLDLVTLFAKGRIHLSYEHFLNKDFSAGISGIFSLSEKAKNDFDANFNRTLPEYEINPYVRYSLSKSEKSYYYLEAFASANGGKYKEMQRLDFGTTAYWTAIENTYFDVALGGAVGYKIYFKNKFAVDLFVGAGKNLFNTSKSPEIVPRVGASFGYRF